MGRNLRHAGNFRRTLNAGVRRTTEQVIQFQKEHGIALLTELQKRTPRLSGLLVSSWTASGVVPSDWRPLTPVPLMNRTAFMSAVQGLKLGESIHITNNQPYARRLESGHGPKNPPSGFVRPSLRAYKKRVKKVPIG